MLSAGRLRSHSGVVGFSFRLCAGWLVRLLRLLHVAGWLGGAGTGGHRIVQTKLNGEEKLKARSGPSQREAAG